MAKPYFTPEGISQSHVSGFIALKKALAFASAFFLVRPQGLEPWTP